MKRSVESIARQGHRWIVMIRVILALPMILGLPMTLGLIVGIGISSPAGTQTKGPGTDSRVETGKTPDGNQQRRSKKPDDKQQEPSEITDRSLYSEVIFAEIFEKDIDKACTLLEQLLARRPKNTDLSRDAYTRYHRLALTSGQVDRYLAYLDKVLERKDLDDRYRGWITKNAATLRGKWGKELRRRVDAYKSQLDEAKDKTPAQREALRKELHDSIYNYIYRSRSTPRQPDPGSREDLNSQHAKKIQRAQELQSQIDKLKKAGRGKSKEAEKLRGELRRVIQEPDSPQRGNRGGSWRGRGSMQGFYNARKKIEDSGDTKRLAEFDKLRVELQNLGRSRQYQKARNLLKEAEKRFPELKRNRRR